MNDRTYGDLIREYRQKAGMTQRQLAAEIGSATGTVQQYERGLRQPRYEQLQKIAKALKTSIYNLTPDDTPEQDDEPFRAIDDLRRIVPSGFEIYGTNEDGDSWIKYPDGYVGEITLDDVEKVLNDIEVYSEFALEKIRHK